MNTNIYKAAKDNIVDIIAAYVPLKKKGHDYKACCPFHDEKTPSFSVSPKKGLYHCFGCGEGGDGITFVQRYLNLDHLDACQKVADFLNFGEVTFTKEYKLPEKPKPICTLPIDNVLKKYGVNYEQPDNFTKGLIRIFGKEKTQKVCTDFLLCQVNEKTLFLECQENKVYYGQIMGYNSETLKRIKGAKFADIMSFGAFLAKQFPNYKAILDFNAYYRRRLFGGHLIKAFQEIRIVESQKTALIANIYNFSEYAAKKVLYVATGGLSNLNEDLTKFDVLRFKKVLLVPDADPNFETYKKWSEKIPYLNSFCSPEMDREFLESCTSDELAAKVDLADKILKEFIF